LSRCLLGCLLQLPGRCLVLSLVQLERARIGDELIKRLDDVVAPARTGSSPCPPRVQHRPHGLSGACAPTAVIITGMLALRGHDSRIIHRVSDAISMVVALVIVVQDQPVRRINDVKPNIAISLGGFAPPRKVIFLIDPYSLAKRFHSHDASGLHSFFDWCVLRAFRRHGRWAHWHRSHCAKPLLRPTPSPALCLPVGLLVQCALLGSLGRR
jgi:hypothetical protein